MGPAPVTCNEKSNSYILILYFTESLSACPSFLLKPIMLGDAALATTLASRLLQRGIYVIGFSYPVVPKGQARIRVQISAAHTRQQLEDAVGAFTEVGKELGIVD